MMQTLVDWVTEGISLGNLAAFVLVLVVFRDRLFGHISLKTLKNEVDSHEDKNEKAHRELGEKIDVVRDNTQYMRGVLDTLKERVK